MCTDRDEVNNLPRHLAQKARELSSEASVEKDACVQQRLDRLTHIYHTISPVEKELF